MHAKKASIDVDEQVEVLLWNTYSAVPVFTKVRRSGLSKSLKCRPLCGDLYVATFAGVLVGGHIGQYVHLI
jgi:hypothetical protein